MQRDWTMDLFCIDRVLWNWLALLIHCSMDISWNWFQMIVVFLFLFEIWMIHDVCICFHCWTPALFWYFIFLCLYELWVIIVWFIVCVILPLDLKIQNEKCLNEKPFSIYHVCAVWKRENTTDCSSGGGAVPRIA